MNAIETGARRLKYWLGFQDDSRIVIALRPGYNKFLDLLFYKRGLVRVLHGVETILIRPAHRYFRNDFEPALFHFLRRTVRQGDTVLEVGANVGVFTTLLARWVGPTGRVYAFEPSPIARAALEDHLALNGVADRVTVVPRAVSDVPGRSVFYEHGASGENTLSKTHSRIPNANALEVDVTTLDTFCKDRGILPTLIKIDIEGFELHALKGARLILRDCGPTVVMEMHPMNWSEVGISSGDMGAFLAEAGYRLRALGSQTEPLSEYGHVVLQPVEARSAQLHPAT
jgi:FkbM family methyltransferase